MTTFTSLCIAGATALALTSGVAAPSMAQETLVNLVTGQTDPFEVSKQICVEKQIIDTSCFTNEGQVGFVTIGDIVDMMKSDITKIRSINGWGEEVTRDTEFPLGATLRFG